MRDDERDLSVQVLEDTFKSKDEKSIIDQDVILLVGKDFEFITAMRDRLEKEQDFHVTIALTIRKAADLFYSMKPAFILVDLGVCGEEIGCADRFVKLVYQSQTPIALVNEEVSLERRVHAYELGATDYIDKKVLDPKWFIPYLRNRLEDQQRVLVDELTGAYNRKYMERLLENLLADYERNDEVFSIVMIDLDYFKQVNDEHGHLVGDEVLRKLVDTINQYKRKTDHLCRFGGEEFQLSLPGTDAQTAAKVIERIRKYFSEVIFKVGEETFNVTFSAGITEVNGQNQQNHLLIDEADKALYQSKASGRNYTTIYSRTSEVTILRRLHVIIVDDDRLIRTMLERSFKEWEFDRTVEIIVHTYEDGVDFLGSDWYNPNDKYMILLDGIMPRMNGIAVLKKVREIYPDRDIVISMLSARSSESYIVHALEKGADDYMLKPFKMPEVIARVDRLARRMLF